MQSETVGKLAEALSKAQGEMRPAAMDRNNPFFKSKYATLASLWDSARKAIADNGLSVVQTTEMYESDLILITTLMHASGEWVSGMYPVRAVGSKPQEIGSAITYARRYAFGAILGLSADDDDDGNAASGKDENVKPAQAQNKAASQQHQEKREVWQSWMAPQDAFAWACSTGAVVDNDTAKELFKNLVTNTFAGKFSTSNDKLVYQTYFSQVNAMLMKQADAVTVAGVPEMAF